jgi:hypothetical protein
MEQSANIEVEPFYYSGTIPTLLLLCYPAEQSQGFDILAETVTVKLYHMLYEKWNDRSIHGGT